MSFRQIGVRGVSEFIGIRPLLLKAFQYVCVLNIGGVNVIEGGILNGKNIFLVRKNQFTRIVKNDFQHRFISRYNVFVGYQEF